MNMQGSLLVSSKKFIDLDSDKRDRFGLALPRVHLHYEDSDVAMARDMVATSEDVIKAAGGRVWSTPKEISPQTLVIDLNHWVGTCKMGTDPENFGCKYVGTNPRYPKSLDWRRLCVCGLSGEESNADEHRFDLAHERAPDRSFPERRGLNNGRRAKKPF